MTIREELGWIVDLSQDQEDKIVQLFKKRALEMVGEPDNETETPNNYIRFGVNATKDNIKERIEKSTE